MKSEEHLNEEQLNENQACQIKTGNNKISQDRPFIHKTN